MSSFNDEAIAEKLYNIEMVVEEIKQFPHTYDTLLGECRKNGTYQQILRRKLQNLCNDGVVCKCVIPGTRFGKVIFFALPKTYFIAVESDLIGVNVYVFFKYVQSGKFNIILNEYWILNGDRWTKSTKEKVLFEGKILKMI